MNVNFQAIYEEYRNPKGGFGEPEIKKATEWFQKTLTSKVAAIIKEAEAEKRRDRDRGKSLHEAFDAAGEDKAPKPEVIEFALHYLEVPIFPVKNRQAEREKLLHLLESNSDPKTCHFATLVSGPQSGLIRCRTLDGEETALYKRLKKDSPNAIKYGTVQRGPRTKTSTPAQPVLQQESMFTPEETGEAEETAAPAASAGKKTGNKKRS